MKQNFKAILLIFGLFGVVFFTSYKSVNNKFKKEHSHNINIKKARTITIGKPEIKVFKKEMCWFGEVKPVNKLNLISPISGEIERIYIKNGEYLKKGDKILKLGGKVINNRISLLNLKIKNLYEKIKLAKKVYEFKKLSFSKKLIKKDELLSAENNYFNLLNQLKLLKNELRMINEKRIIISPINGIFLTENFFTQGQLLNKGDSFGRIISTDKLKIVGHIFIENPKILINKKVNINGHSFIITRVLPFKDSQGACIFWIEDRKISKYFEIGQKITGKIIINQKRSLCVPEDAIVVDENNNSWVFIKEGNKFQKTKVITGTTQDGFIEILSGLKLDDKIVIKGAFELFYKDFSKTFKVED